MLGFTRDRFPPNVTCSHVTTLFYPQLSSISHLESVVLAAHTTNAFEGDWSEKDSKDRARKQIVVAVALLLLLGHEKCQDPLLRSFAVGETMAGSCDN